MHSSQTSCSPGQHIARADHFNSTYHEADWGPFTGWKNSCKAFLLIQSKLQWSPSAWSHDNSSCQLHPNFPSRWQYRCNFSSFGLTLHRCSKVQSEVDTCFELNKRSFQLWYLLGNCGGLSVCKTAFTTATRSSGEGDSTVSKTSLHLRTRKLYWPAKIQDAASVNRQTKPTGQSAATLRNWAAIVMSLISSTVSARCVFVLIRLESRVRANCKLPN